MIYKLLIGLILAGLLFALIESYRDRHGQKRKAKVVDGIRILVFDTFANYFFKALSQGT